MRALIPSFVALAFSCLAVATPLNSRQDATNQCNTGSAQCCNTLQEPNNPALASIVGPLGVVLQDVTALVGVTCTPITVVGVTGGSCSAQPVCCTNASFNGLVALGCTPITISV